MDSEANWNKIRQEIIEATAGIDPEKLVISTEICQNTLGERTIFIQIHTI